MSAPARPQPDGPSPQLLAAMAAYQAQTQALRTQLTAYVQRLWRSLGSWRQGDIPRFVAQVVPVVAGAQRQMVALTAANLAQQRQLAVGGLFVPQPVDPKAVSGAAARNGTDPAEVYGRPFHLVWRQLDELPREPGSIDQAITAGMDRAVESAVTDVQLTKQRTAFQVLGRDGRVTGYRRVLEGAYSCALCIVASTQRYHRSELLPVHPACDCSVQPIYGDADPGQLIDPDTLADVHQRIEERFGHSSSAARIIPGAKDGRGKVIRYRDVLVTHEHSELGPVLAVRGQPHADYAA